jgi:hypothetical protein
MDPETSKRLFGEANAFGDQVCQLLQAIGHGTRRLWVDAEIALVSQGLP